MWGGGGKQGWGVKIKNVVDQVDQELGQGGTPSIEDVTRMLQHLGTNQTWGVTESDRSRG